MAFFPVTSQIRGYTDPRDGSPLTGTLRFGLAGQDPEATEVQMYWDLAGTQPAPQPIPVRNGYAIRGRTPSNLFTDADFSSIARDARGRLVYTVANSLDFQALGTIAASTVSVVDTGGFYTAADVEAILAEIGANLATLATGNIPTGAMFPYCGGVANGADSAPPTGFVFASGQTIGNGSSGALSATHQRANADCATLFTLLWNVEGTPAIGTAGVQLPIQDSTGAASVRGASAAADFAANKRLPVPDMRGRVSAGKDDMGTATAAGRLTAATILGTTQFNANALTETHTLTTSQLASHNHTQNAHNHTVTITDPGHNHTDSGHTHGVTTGNVGGAVPSLTLTTGASGTNNTNTGSANLVANTTGVSAVTVNTTATNNSAGSGAAHNNVQPTIISTVIIKL